MSRRPTPNAQPPTQSPFGRRTWWAVSGLALVLTAVPGFACDICSVYTATELQESRTGVRVGIAEQYTSFASLQQSGHEAPNPYDEHLESSITQVVLGYSPHPRLNFQVNVPIINRDYRRVEQSGVVTGDETGVGDVSLVSTGELYSYVDEHSVFRLSGLFGIKLPTGSPRRLREELEPDDTHDSSDPQVPPVFQSGQRYHPRHETGPDTPPSGIHGHDLTLGSGSADVLLGMQALATLDRFFFTTAMRYSVRTEGAYGYLFADELIVNGGPGYYALLAHDYSLGVQAVVTVDTKGTDSLNGMREGDTALTAVYAGPGFHFTWTSSLSTELVADIPAILHNSALQIVPDYRLRGGLVWRF